MKHEKISFPTYSFHKQKLEGKNFPYMAFPLFCELQGEPKASPTASEHNKFVSPNILLNLKNCARPTHGSYVERGHFLWAGSHKIAKHFRTL